MPTSDTKHNSYIQYRQKTHEKHHIDLDLEILCRCFIVARLLTIDPVNFLHTRSLITDPITISTVSFAISIQTTYQHSQTIEFKFNACAIRKSFSSIAFLCTRAAYLCNLFRMNIRT